MKIPLGLLAIVGVFLALFWFVAPPTNEQMAQPRTDLPWQVKALPNGNLQVFDLELGADDLQAAVNKFGEYEGAAVFRSEEGDGALEVYFGKVNFGPLTARVIVALEASIAELDDFVSRATERKGSPTGDWKFTLAPDDVLGLNARKLTVITYVPGTRGLDTEFFRSRFGDPVAWMRESEEAVSWFYPDLGLSVLVDADKSEVLEYTRPSEFVLPDGTKSGASAEAARAATQD